jgi:hypothetical protein
MLDLSSNSFDTSVMARAKAPRKFEMICIVSFLKSFLRSLTFVKVVDVRREATEINRMAISRAEAIRN